MYIYINIQRTERGCCPRQLRPKSPLSRCRPCALRLYLSIYPSIFLYLYIYHCVHIYVCIYIYIYQYTTYRERLLFSPTPLEGSVLAPPSTCAPPSSSGAASVARRSRPCAAAGGVGVGLYEMFVLFEAFVHEFGLHKIFVC